MCMCVSTQVNQSSSSESTHSLSHTHYVFLYLCAFASKYKQSIMNITVRFRLITSWFQQLLCTVIYDFIFRVTVKVKVRVRVRDTWLLFKQAAISLWNDSIEYSTRYFLDHIDRHLEFLIATSSFQYFPKWLKLIFISLTKIMASDLNFNPCLHVLRDDDCATLAKHWRNKL